MHELFGTQAIPVVLTEEADAGQPAGALEPVKVVKLPLGAGAEILADLKVAGEPVDAALKTAVDAAGATVLDRFTLQELSTLKSPEPRDDQAGDPCAGHAGGRDIGIGGIGPASVAFLAALPVQPRKLPDGLLHGHADLAGGMQTQQGVLGVGIIARPSAFGLGVAPRAGPVLRVTGLDLGLLKPVDVGRDPDRVFGGVGRRVDHRLQRDRVGAVQVARA